jgi:hypothetical protein
MQETPQIKPPIPRILAQKSHNINEVSKTPDCNIVIAIQEVDRAIRYQPIAYIRIIFKLS